VAGTPAPPSRLSVTLDSPLPASIPAGGAVALFWMGSASEDGGPVGGMDLVVDGVAHSPGASRMPRFQAACRRSGFWGLVPLRADRAAGTIVLAAEEPSRVRGGGLLGGAGGPLENYIGEVTKYVIRKAPCRVILTAPPDDRHAEQANDPLRVPER